METTKPSYAMAIDFGPLAEIKDCVLELGPEVKMPGKVFGGAFLRRRADFGIIRSI